jgi:hypothetical protein
MKDSCQVFFARIKATRNSLEAPVKMYFSEKLTSNSALTAKTFGTQSDEISCSFHLSLTENFADFRTQTENFADFRTQCTTELVLDPFYVSLEGVGENITVIMPCGYVPVFSKHPFVSSSHRSSASPPPGPMCFIVRGAFSKVS